MPKSSIEQKEIRFLSTRKSLSIAYEFGLREFW